MPRSVPTSGEPLRDGSKRGAFPVTSKMASGKHSAGGGRRGAGGPQAEDQGGATVKGRRATADMVPERRKGKSGVAPVPSQGAGMRGRGWRWWRRRKWA